MLDGGEREVTGSAAVCAADYVADLVYYAAEGERLVGLVKTRRLAAMQKQQCAKALDAELYGTVNIDFASLGGCHTFDLLLEVLEE